MEGIMLELEEEGFSVQEPIIDDNPDHARRAKRRAPVMDIEE